MAKPIVIEVYDSGNHIRKFLTDNQFKFKEEDFLSGFWGKRFTVEHPRGKGTNSKLKALRENFHV